MKRNLLFVILYISICGVIRGQESNDTIKITTLEEYTVQGESEYFTPQKAVFFPSEDAKKHSSNGMELIAYIGIPQLNYSPASGEITTAAGLKVEYFINGVQAQQYEVLMMNTKYAYSVEYLDHPSDPKFKGAPYVVNFILYEPEYGGYTRIIEDVEYASPIGKNLMVYSKFKYRRMTFDALAQYGYFNTQKIATTVEQNYELKKNNDNYNLSMHYEPTDARYILNSIPITFRALYSNDNISISNIIGFKFAGNKDCHMDQDLFVNSPYENFETTYKMRSPEDSRSVSWKGDYYFSLKHGFAFLLSPSFSYTNQTSSRIQEYGNSLLEKIETTSNADSYIGKIFAQVTKSFNSHHSLSLGLSGNIQYAKTFYSGNSNFIQRYLQFTEELSLNYIFNSNKLQLQFGPYLNYSIIHTGATDQGKFLPGFSTNIGYASNVKNSINLYLSSVMQTPPLVTWTEGIIQQTPYLYKTGSKNMKKYNLFSLSFNYSYMPIRNLFLTAILTYYGSFNRPILEYNQFLDGAALLAKYSNNGDFHDIMAGLNIEGFFFNDKLRISLSPRIDHYKSTGLYSNKLTRLSAKTTAYYFLNNFTFSAYWESSKKAMSPYFYEVTRVNDLYGLIISYKHGNWHFSIKARNFLKNDYKSEYSFYEVPFMKSSNTAEAVQFGRNFSFHVSYIFEYGKRQNKNEIEQIKYVKGVVLN